jgi:hypothetical protein
MMTMTNEKQEGMEVVCALVSAIEGRASLSTLSGTERG